MIHRIRLRSVLVAALAGALSAALGVTVAAAHSAPYGAIAIDLPVSNLNTPAGGLTALRAGTTYRASSFPLGLHVTTPDGSWAGSQWKTSSRGRPAFGWAGLGHGHGLTPPQGLIEIVTAFGTTPPVATILSRLHSAGGGATFGPATRVKLGGLAAWQFDGNVFGVYGHAFVPFSPKTGGASPPDTYKLEQGEAFRVIVLSARGKRVVVFMDSAQLPADQFPVFLVSAQRFLASLRFTT